MVTAVVCRASFIPFRSSLAHYALMACRVGGYLPSNSLQRPRSTERGSHILTFATQHVKESLKNLSPWGKPLLCSGRAGASCYPFVCTARGGGTPIRSPFW